MTPFSGTIRLNIAIAAALGLMLMEEARRRKVLAVEAAAEFPTYPVPKAI
jgi:hypothetical protein